MKNIVIICIAFFALGCKKSEQNEAVFIGKNVPIVFRDTEGRDLLNTNYPNAVIGNKINVYYLVNNQKVNPDLQSSGSGFAIIKDASYLQLHLNLNIMNEEFIRTKKTTTFINYGDGREDKIVAEFNANTGSNVRYINLWINDVQVSSGHFKNGYATLEPVVIIK